VGSAQRADLDPAASGGGLVDLRAAAQLELYAEPAVVSFGRARRLGAERLVRVHNVSTRTLVVGIDTAALAPKGVVVTVDPERVRIRPGGSAELAVLAETGALSPEAGSATGELVLRAAGSTEARTPWAVAVPRRTDLLSRVVIAGTDRRVTDAAPAVLSLVVGAVAADPDPQVRAVARLELRLERAGELLGVLARRRELLPGRYSFGLTGRGPTGARLPRGAYRLRVVAFPGDGTPRQVETVPYRVR
jgi:hypothetical protein